MQGSFLVNDLRKVISIVDLLRDIGLGTLLALPKVVVLGNQSSGKSSLLEQIVGLDFLPRGSGVVTRRPLELRMNNVPNLANPYAEFDEITEKGTKKKFTNFKEVRQSIDYVTDQVCGKNKQIIDKPIVLNVFSKSCPNLTVIDLPGITSIPVGDQPKDIYEITRSMALRYIKEERAIILCVIPANQDLATSQALKIMQEIDPSGQRSIGCLTKIDIMNRGDDARKMLKNEEIPLRYGYVGIKNRCQEDVTNNVPVEESLKSERKFFTTSPIYSTLPSDLFGTSSLTQKLTNILYHQIKNSMPKIFEQIKSKKKSAQEELEKLGPGVANTDAEMVNYAWKSVATFLRVYKNSLNGIKSSEYSNDPISSNIREELNFLYKDQYDEPATEDITDRDIEKAMVNFPGDSTIPGFPSIDAFLSLLNPLLKRLQNPAYEANNKVHEILETEAMTIINDVLCTKYPEFNSRFKDLIRKILDKYRRNLEGYLNSLLDSELFYLFTNDINYLVGDFHKVAETSDKKAPRNPLVYELRKRIDAYYKLVVRNLRDLIPKQVFNFLIIKCMKELEFEAFQFTSDVNKLKEWLNEPSQVRIRRTECMKAIKVFEESEKRIRMDPDISKLVRRTEKQSKYYGKFGMKTPDQMREEEEKRVKEHYELISKSTIKTLSNKSNSEQRTSDQRKPDPPRQNPPPSSHNQPPPAQRPPTNPQPQQKVQPTNNTGKGNQPSGGGKVDFDNFFGPGQQGQQQGQPQPQQRAQNPPPQQNNPTSNNTPSKQPLGGGGNPNPNPNQGKPNFDNFFGTNPNPNQPANNPNGMRPPNQQPQPQPQTQTQAPKPQPPAEQNQDQTKKRTFNKLFGIGP